MPTNDDRPNIILMNCDDLGYGDPGCYGSTANATPAIDGLAAQGMRFTDFYMANCVCSPSRGAMMTGCYPGRIPAGVECNEVVTAMDFLPTFARLAGTGPPDDRVIDGTDIRPLLLGEPGAKSKTEAVYYYRVQELQAVRVGDWKLHVLSGELYNLAEDIGEQINVADRNPDVVQRLEAQARQCRQDLGDSATGIEGANRRPIGRVENAGTLTEYDPDHPYMIALYDGGVG